MDDFVSFGSVLYFWVPRQVDSSSLVFFFRVFLVFFCSVFCFLFPRFFVFFFSKSSQHVSNPIFPSFQDHLLFFFRIEEFFFQFFVSVMHLKCHFSLWLGPFSEFVSFFPSFFDHIFEHLISFRQQFLFPFFRLFNTLPTDCPDFSKKK